MRYLKFNILTIILNLTVQVCVSTRMISLMPIFFVIIYQVIYIILNNLQSKDFKIEDGIIKSNFFEYPEYSLGQRFLDNMKSDLGTVFQVSQVFMNMTNDSSMKLSFMSRGMNK